MLKDMEKWISIRRRVLGKEISKRQACREYGIGWRTLEKVLIHEEPPAYQLKEPRRKPKLQRFLPIIHGILEADQQAPKKQRHTAQRIFDRLVHEEKYDGGVTIVKEAVRRVETAKASSLSLVRFHGNDYSVPTACAHHQVTIIGGIEEVRLVVDNRLVAQHPRHWGKEHTQFDPVHYLALLERKPGALDYARPLENWDLPGCFAVFRRRQEICRWLNW